MSQGSGMVQKYGDSLVAWGARRKKAWPLSRVYAAGVRTSQPPGATAPTTGGSPDRLVHLAEPVVQHQPPEAQLGIGANASVAYRAKRRTTALAKARRSSRW